MPDSPVAQVTFDEPDFTPQELAKLKKFHVSKIIRLFRDEPGVLRIGKTHFTLRIPRRVAERVFASLTVTK
jgi:hypothetical protein